MNSTEHYLASILESITDGLVTLDQEWRFTYVNAEAERVLGRTRANLIGMCVWEEYPHNLGTEVERELRRVAVERVPSTFQGHDPTRDRWYDNRVFPIPDGGVVIYFRDVTESRALQVERNRLTAIVESSEDAIISKDLNGIILSWNRGAERLYGYSAEEAVGKPLDILVPPDHPNELPGILERLRQGERIAHYETVRLRKDGSRVDVSLTISPLKNEAGQITGASKVARDISDRKRAEEELRVANERLDLALRGSNLGIWDLYLAPGSDNRHEPVRLINTWEALGFDPAGFPTDAVISQALGHPDDLKRVDATLTACLAGETDEIRVENRVRYKDGSYHWLLTLGTAVRDASGRPIRLIGTMLDVTDRKRAEERLRESEERFRRCFELGLIGMAITSPEKGILEVNDEICRILGYTRGELFQKTWAEMTYPDDLAADIAQFDRVVAGEIDGYTLDKRWIRKDGRVIDSTISAKCLRCEDGSVSYFIAQLQDVTERKRAEEALRRDALVLASVSDSVVATDPDGVITFWNEGATRLFGWTAAEMVGRPYADRFPEPERSWIAEQIRSRTAGTKWIGEYLDHRKDGSRVWIDARVGRVTDAAGRPHGIIGVAHDITERKRAEETLRQAHDEMETRVRERTAELARTNEELSAEIQQRRRAEEARTELLRRLATAQEDERRRLSRELHDQVGQQLTSLILALKALRDGGHGLSAEQALLERLQRTTEEVGRELHDVALRLRPTALDDLGLHAALQSAVEEWSRRCGVEADFHSAGLEGQRLSGEVETVLYRVVLEALHNVLKHARATHVSVLLEHRNHHAVAIVEDDGVGFNTESAQSGEPTGRLGLLGMRERVALVGGTLEVESAPGAGTTVFARIPLAPKGEGGQP